MDEDVEMRASDIERDATVAQLQAAYADGRLDNAEFDARVRATLAAKTRRELDRLAADLPMPLPGRLAEVTLARAGLPKAGRLSLAYKTALRRGGHWRVPTAFIAVSCKGRTVLDLSAAELTSAVTTIRAWAYKGTVQVIVPPSIRVQVSGIGVTIAKETACAALAPENAPVVHIRGFAYKGRVEIRSTPA
jgi:hypothetical protein